MPKKPEVADALLSVFECVSPIEHDGERIEVGDVVEFPADVAEPLIAAGALKVSESASGGPQLDPQS